jgi:hypothetical protein
MDRTWPTVLDRGHSRRVAALLAGLALATLAGPASATVVDRTHYAGTDAFSYDDCGFDVDATVEFGGTFQARAGKGDEAGAFFGHNQYWSREVDTRRSDGRTLVISANGVSQDTRAVHVEGSVFEFTSVNAGQPFVVSDASGRALMRDRGSIRETILFDTLGDDVPGGVFIDSVSFRVNGPHPGLSVDLCSLF